MSSGGHLEAYRAAEKVFKAAAAVFADARSRLSKSRSLVYRAAEIVHGNAKTRLNNLVAEAGPLLYKAVRAKNVDECNRLLEIKGVDVSKEAIAFTAVFGREDIMELLISKGGANINEKTDKKNGWSPILLISNCSMPGCVCVHEGTYTPAGDDRLGMAKLLIAAGANVNDTTTDGRSCLMMCSLGLDVAELLLSEGADMRIVSSVGHTCFSIANMHGNHRLLYRLRKWPTTMAILALQALALYHHLDCETIIDLHQYLGRPEDIQTDNEEDYLKDEGGNVLDPELTSDDDFDDEWLSDNSGSLHSSSDED